MAGRKKPGFAELLEYAEAEFADWQSEYIIPERDDRIAKLKGMGLTSGGRAVHAMNIYRQLLGREVRKRIEVYGTFARKYQNDEMLSKQRLDEHHDRIMTSVRHACNMLRDEIERDIAAAGDLPKPAWPDPFRYVQLESAILDIVNSKLKVLRSRGAIMAAQKQPISAPVEQVGSKEVARKKADPQKSRRNPIDEKIDRLLRDISKAFPGSQHEVFAELDVRRVPLCSAEPFRSADGWVAGFARNETLARAWLSKQWGRLGLTELKRGPKGPRIATPTRHQPSRPSYRPSK